MRLYLFCHYSHYVYQGTRCETKQGRQQRRLENTSSVQTPAWIASPSILAREDDVFKRRVKEAIEIFHRAQTLNRDAGYELPAIHRDVSSRDAQYESHDNLSNSIT